MGIFMDMGQKIYDLRTRKGLTLEELGNMVGVGKSTVRKWENGMIANMKRDKILKISKALETTPTYLMGWGDAAPSESKGSFINVLRRVTADMPIDAPENIIYTEEVSESDAKTGNFFGLRIQDDSMEPDIHNGDTVIVRKQTDAENDEIVIALINENDGVCKRLKKYDNSIALVSINAKYEPLYFSAKEIADRPVRIIGKVVELRRKF